MMLNRIVIMGRLGRDPELRYTQAGKPVASFSLAVDRDFKDKTTGEKSTDFIDIVAWRQTAEFVSRFFTKGRMAVVEGRLQLRDWTDRDGNKRTALMVANHQLIHDGIGVFSIPPEDKAQFVSMLLRYYETGDYSRLSDWLSQNAVGHVPGGLTLAQSSGAAEKTNDAANGMGIVPGVPLDGLDGGSGLLR